MQKCTTKWADGGGRLRNHQQYWSRNEDKHAINTWGGNQLFFHQQVV
jgi:hypothetical protein